MAKILGTNVSAVLCPFTTEDKYAVTASQYQKGGWHEVATIADRDAITPARREAGMAVYVTSESKLYTLNADLETWTLFETGKIDTISVNGETQPIEDKNVDITVPTKTSDIDNDSDFQNSTEVQAAIENNIVNNTTSTDTDKSLSAAAGKSLQDQVNNLLGRGKYLSVWDCTTGLAMDEPPVNPYTVETGSYFIVGKVASEGGTNYRPNGGVYDKDVPSTTIETGEVKVNDTYFYDGTVWRLLDVPEKDVAFSSLAGNPRDNDALKAEFEGIESDIAEKADEDDLQAHIDDKNNPHEVTAEQVGLGNVDNVSDLDKPISTATQNALNAKQDKLTAGDNIVIENNVISATIKESSYIAGDNITITPIGYIGTGYKPLLYVQGDGEHYIDTGRPYTANSVITMYAKGYKTFEGSNSECLAGSSTNSTTESSVGFIANGDKYVGGQLGSRAYSNNTDLEMEEIKLNIPEGKIYFNGTNPITHATTPLNINAYLFAYNRDDEAYKVSEGRIQRYTQVDDGVVVLDYVACVRESDNTVGFYDKVSNTFITCEGLTAGPDISNRFEISATDTTYTAGDGIEISEDNEISAKVYSTEPSILYGNLSYGQPTVYKAGKGLELEEFEFPAGVTTKDYIEVSSSYYEPSFTVSSSYKNVHTTVVVDVINVLDTTKTYCVFGCIGTNGSYAFTIEGGKYWVYYKSVIGVDTGVIPNIGADKPDVLEFIDNKAFINGKLVATFAESGVSSGPWFFGSINGNWGVHKTSFAGRLISLKLEYNGAVQRHLVPATFIQSGTEYVGFFDVVRGGQYKPSDNNAIAGNNVIYKSRINAIPYKAGNNVTIDGNVISASGKEYVAGDGIIIDDNEISVDPTIKGNRLAEGAGTLLKKDLPYIIANQGQHAEHIRTGMSPDSDFIYLRFRLTETPTGFGGVFGNGTGNNYCSVTVDTNAQTGQLYFYVRYGSFNTGIAPVDTNWHTVMFYSKGVIFDGKIYAIGPSVQYYSDIVLNALKDGNTYYPLKSEISICKVIRRNGNDISTRTYIPAQRSSDGKIGYFLEEDNAWYFSTTGTEYTIDYTGDYGIYVDNKAIQTKLVPDNSIQIIDNELPVGYQEVEEVDFDAIDTGLCVDPALQYKIVMSVKSSYGTLNRRIMGAYTNNDNTSANIMSLQTDGTDLYYYYAYAQSPSRRKVGSWSSGNWLNIEIIPGVSVKIDGTTTSISGTAARTDKTIYIGAINGQTFPSVNLPAYGRVTITNNASGYVLFNAIPCLRLQDNTYGMYDTISRRFLQSVTSYKISGRYPVPNIKANVPTYTAGTGISISSNNQISAVKGNWEWTSMGTSSVALGESASAFSYSTALGQNAYANGLYSVSIGSYSQTLGYYDISIGNAAKTNSSEQSIAIGSSSNIYGQYNTAIGAYSYIGDVNNYPNYSLVAGYGARTLYGENVVLGHSAHSDYTYNVVIGTSSYSTTGFCVAIGHSAYTSGDRTVSIGSSSHATGDDCVAIGSSAVASASRAIQLGKGSNASEGTLKFRSYPLVDTNGHIPASRLADIGKRFEGRVLTLDDNSDPAWLEVNGLPEQSGHSGQYLTTNGTTASWANVAVYTAGNGISINNNVLSAKTDNTTIGFDANGNLKVLEREPEYDPEEEMLIFDWGEDNPKYIEDEEEIVF